MSPRPVTAYNTRYRLSAHWQLWLVMEIRGVAEDLGDEKTVAEAELALPVVEAAVAASEAAAIGRGKHLGSADAANLDTQADRLISGMHDTLTAVIRNGDEDPRFRGAQELLQNGFPRGLAGHVNATHQEQAAMNRRLIATCKVNPNLISDLGLTITLKRLEAVQDSFLVALRRASPVSADEAARAQDLGEEAVLLLIYGVIVSYKGRSSEDQEKLRDRILDPVLAANKKLHRIYQERAKKKEEKVACEEEDQKKDTGKAKAADKTGSTSPASKTDAAAQTASPAGKTDAAQTASSTDTSAGTPPSDTSTTSAVTQSDTPATATDTTWLHNPEPDPYDDSDDLTDFPPPPSGSTADLMKELDAEPANAAGG